MNIISEREIHTGDSLLVSGKTWLARRIQWFQKCKWNHAEMFVRIDGDLYICGAEKHGVALTPFERYKKEHPKSKYLVLKTKFGIHEKRREYIRQFMLPYCGHKPYGYINLLVYQPIKFLTGIWLGRSEHKSTNRFICGKWVMFVYNEVFQMFPSWYKGAPVDIYNSDEFKHYEIWE